MLDMKMYKDGNRTILVFNNCKPDMEKVISSVISGIAGNEVPKTEIQSVLPMKTEETPMPAIPEETPAASMPEESLEYVPEEPSVVQENPAPAIPDIQENELYQQSGFYGFAYVGWYYQYYKDYLSESRRMELENFLGMHKALLKQSAGRISLEELRRMLEYGFQSIWANALPDVLRQTTAVSMEALLQTGEATLRQVFSYLLEVC